MYTCEIFTSIFYILFQSAAKIVHLLLDHKANADVLCNGHSPLSLAIISGNDEVKCTTLYCYSR